MTLTKLLFIQNLDYLEENIAVVKLITAISLHINWSFIQLTKQVLKIFGIEIMKIKSRDEILRNEKI